MGFLSTTIGKVVGALVIALLVFGALQVRSCQQARQQAAQSKVDRGQAGAQRESAKDAIATQGNVSANDQEAADLDRRNRKEIEDAEGSGERVSDSATAAGRRGLCRRAAYRNRPECRVREPDPR